MIAPTQHPATTNRLVSRLPLIVEMTIGAIAGAVLGVEAVTGNRHQLAQSLGSWAVRHGWAKDHAVEAYEAVFRQNIERLIPGLVIYVLFGLYWTIASRNRGKDAQPEAPASTAIHKLLLLLSMLLICLPPPGLTQVLLPAAPVWLALGIILEIGGAALAIAARVALGRNWSREARIAVGHELVRSGPYARIRHPIYTGALMISLGLAIESGLLAASIGLAVVIIAYIRKIGLEERLLQGAFGPAFDDYRRASWALIPYLI